MRFMYLLSQLLVIISTVILALSYLSKSKKNVMLLCVLYCIFYGIHYLLLGAYTGLTMTTISGVRNIWFYNGERKNKSNNIYSLILFVLVSIISGIITYQNLFSIVSIFGNITSTYSVWQKNIKKYRILAIPVSICFLIYAIYLKSVFAIITETFLLIIELLSVYNLKKESSEKYV